MNKKQHNEQERQESITSLRELLKPGDTVYTILRHCSASGMYRAIDVMVIGHNKPMCITWSIALVLGYKRDDKHNGALKVGGCGMDMGFHVVYELGRCLFPEGFGDEGDYPNGSKGRPATKEMAEKALAIGVKFHGRNGDKSGWDNDGGYALKQQWL